MLCEYESPRASSGRAPRTSCPDPFNVLVRFGTKVHTVWLKATYGFAKRGCGLSIHYTCDISRTEANYISFGENVFLAENVWLNVVPGRAAQEPKIVLNAGCKIGRRSTISAKNRIELGPDVLLAPNVLIMDHNHEYSDPERPIHAQGVTQGGRISIGSNCWLGHGSVVLCNAGELSLGRNCIVGANSVVTKSFPPYSVVAGSPARLIKRYDAVSQEWRKVQPGMPLTESLTASSPRGADGQRIEYADRQ